AKYKEYEAALEKIPQVNSLADPVFSFGYFISPVETRVGPQRARFSLSQMFPWFGTLKAQGDAATLMAEAKFQSFIDVRNKLFYRVAAAYYPLYELQHWQQIEQENIEILESYKSVATKKFENGKAAMADVLRVDIMLNDAITNLKILKDKEQPLRVSFNKLLNRNENDSISIVDSIDYKEFSAEYYNDSLFENHPLLSELDLKIKAAEAGELAAKKKGLPQIGLGLDYVIIGERTDLSGAAASDLNDNGKDAFMPMLSVGIPIYRSKYKAAVKENRLMQESYALQKQEQENALKSNIEMQWFELRQQLDLLKLYEQQIQSSRQTLNLLYSAYSNDNSDFEEVLRMQQQLLKYRKMKATALAQYNIGLAKFNYLTAKT
ncbi:MAG: TolC family protein, partial [Chitinophagales bacterium]